MKDSQKNRLYRWENRFGISRGQWLGSPGSLRTLIRDASALYDVKPPVLRRKPDKKGWSHYWSDHSITLSKQHWNPWVALHEAAHGIVRTYYGWDDVEGHGPEFLGVLIHLLAKSGVMRKKDLEASARSAGLKFKNLPPSALFKRRKLTKKKGRKT